MDYIVRDLSIKEEPVATKVVAGTKAIMKTPTGRLGVKLYLIEVNAAISFE